MNLFELLFSSPGTRRREDRRKQRNANYSGVERRKQPDRRGLPYGISFETFRALAPLEDWLEDMMAGRYRLSIEGISDDLDSKHVRVMFAHEADREAFKAYVADYIDGRR
ncbi:hypothetical protein N9L49_02240 [Rhodospirillales bacterium]|mgnify:FL=1|nr:hypothetical protein [Rhodospirillales bacterium]